MFDCHLKHVANISQLVEGSEIAEWIRNLEQTLVYWYLKHLGDVLKLVGGLVIAKWVRCLEQTVIFLIHSKMHIDPQANKRNEKNLKKLWTCLYSILETC